MNYTSNDLMWKIAARDDEILRMSSQLNERDRKICEMSGEMAGLRNVNAILRGDVEDLRARPHQKSHDLLKAANTALAEENQQLRHEQLKASVCWRTEVLSLRKGNAGLRDLIVDRDVTIGLLREDKSEARKLARIAKILEG